MTKTHIKLDTAIAAAMIKARDIGVKMLASDCEQILKASGLSDGVSVALKYLRNKIEEYDREYARQDYETGAWEFGSNAQEEYSNSMHELIEEIESLVSLASAPEVSGDAVATLALKNSELQNRVEILEDLLSSAYCIANRNGEGTHWQRFASRLHVHGISPVTAKTFHILPSDEGYVPDRTAQLEADKARLVEALRKAQPACVIASDFKYDDGDEDAAQEWNMINVSVSALIAEMEAKG